MDLRMISQEKKSNPLFYQLAYASLSFDKKMAFSLPCLLDPHYFNLFDFALMKCIPDCLISENY
jgi:hypothetical protein